MLLHTAKGIQRRYGRCAVRFELVGAGEAVDDLQHLAQHLDVSNVVFRGGVYDELPEVGGKWDEEALLVVFLSCS